jgi:hypothetical protein
MIGVIVPIINFAMYILKLFGVSKDKRDDLKRSINVQIRKIINSPSNSTIIRDQHKKANQDLDDWFDGKGGK